MCISTASVEAQTPISRYAFDGNLTNASSFPDKNSTPAPDGILREGQDTVTVVPAIFALGVDGTADGALVLNGSNQWLDITVDGHPGETVPQGGSSGPGLLSGTVMAWVKMSNSVDEDSQWLMGNSNATGFQSWRMGWDGSQLHTEANAADAADSELVISDSSSNTIWSDGAWHHIAVSWDGFPSVTNNAQYYVDGLPVGDPVTSASIPTSADAQDPWEFPMAIGAMNNAGTLEGFWDGTIDDLQIFAGKLTDSKVKSIFDDVDVSVIPDFDEDNDVDGNDFLIWQRGFQTGTTLQEGDANGSMSVDQVDLQIWQASYGFTVAVEPDFNNDNQVDGADFLIWQRGFQTGTTFEEGDANGDEMVDGTDLDIWKAAYGNVTPGISAAQAVPEPASMMLVALGTLAFLRRELAGAS